MVVSTDHCSGPPVVHPHVASQDVCCFPARRERSLRRAGQAPAPGGGLLQDDLQMGSCSPLRGRDSSVSRQIDNSGKEEPPSDRKKPRGAGLSVSDRIRTLDWSVAPG